MCEFFEVDLPKSNLNALKHLFHTVYSFGWSFLCRLSCMGGGENLFKWHFP